MVLSYVQLLLVCFAFWSSRHAVARALRGQWHMALPFGGTALLCLLVAKSEWVILALVDGALLIAARRIETSRQSKPEPWIESGWGVLCMVTLMLLVLLDVAIFGLVMPLGGLAAWLVAWLPLIALSGGVSALFVRDDAMLPTGEPVVDRLVSWIDDRIDDLIDRGQQMLPPLSAADLGLEVEWVGFYEKGEGHLPAEERRYSWSFPQETTRYIMFEVNMRIRKRKRWRNARCPIVYRYYKPDGSLWKEVSDEWLIKAKWVSFDSSRGWGYPYSGQWRPGGYRVELLIDGKIVAKSSYTIEPPPVRFCGTGGRLGVSGRVERTPP